VAGQAMHWFDPERASREMARVLVPGGVLAGLWNLEDDRVTWVRRYAEVSGGHVSLSQWEDRPLIPQSPWFPVLEHARFTHSQRRTAESMAANLATHSHVLVMDEGERRALLDRVLGFLRSTAETATGEFDVPLVTVAVRGIRA
jgi:SAM-dependent methyltransferase